MNTSIRAKCAAILVLGLLVSSGCGSKSDAERSAGAPPPDTRQGEESQTANTGAAQVVPDQAPLPAVSEVANPLPPGARTVLTESPSQPEIALPGDQVPTSGAEPPWTGEDPQAVKSVDIAPLDRSFTRAPRLDAMRSPQLPASEVAESVQSVPRIAPAPAIAPPVDEMPQAYAASPSPAGGAAQDRMQIAETAPLEPAAEPGQELDPPTAVPADVVPSERPYEVVTVFYGTDRNVLDQPSLDRANHRPWFYLAALATAFAALLGVAAAVRPAGRQAWLGSACLFGLLAAGLGVVAVSAWWQFDPELTGPSRVYSNGRGKLEMGTCQVSIPVRHEVGVVERPSIFRFEFQEDPGKHFVLLDVRQEQSDAFFARLKDRVGVSARKEAFVFVHGFNVTFEAAAQRTAQLAYDLKFDGAPIFYSWPSQGGLLQYAVDETNVVWTVPHLKEFLTAVAHKSGAASVHLIAHSMGNRALTSALQTLSYEMQDQRPLFNEVVLTAPDIDADVFRRDIAPAIIKTAERVTLYASSNDEALALSKQVHGYPRAGDSGGNMVIVPGIDTIDVSSVDTSLLGHSYYGSNHTVLADLLDLVNDRKPPTQRQWLRPMQLGRLAYWAFVAETERLRTAVSSEPPVR